MQREEQNDDVVMPLVEFALGLAIEDREAYLRTACKDDTELFIRAWQYVRWEQRLKGFLNEPLWSITSDEHPFTPGDLLEGRFRIRREVARGGMGIVYEAFDEKLYRRIAVKCAKRGFQNRLPPEVRHASEISHPNVCKIFEIHTAPTSEGDIDFITMEFLEGPTLSGTLQGKLPKKQARTIALQVCAGVAEAHRHQLIHGDLKSNNVILTTAADGTIRAVITDFGLARRPGTGVAAHQSSPRGGTPSYMAPELWAGQKASPASDVYALGVILRELVLGQLPHEAETVSDRRKARLVRRPHLSLPRKWERVIGKCLEPDPGKRFRDAAEVAAALSPSHSRRFVLAGVVAIILAIVSGMVAYQQARPPAELVRLAILPFDTDAAARPLTEGLLIDAGNRLSRVKPGRARLTVIPLSDALQNNVNEPARARTMLGATHSLSGELRIEGGRIRVKTYVTDTRSLVRLAERSAQYRETELENLPVALAGMITATLKLSPIPAETRVNPAAYPDFVAGTSLARRDSDIDHAISLLERAVAADSNSPLTYASLADAEFSKYVLTEEPRWKERALASLKQAEQRNPDLSVVRFVSGRINDNDGRYEEAEADYKRAIELESNNADAWRRLGTTYEHQNRANEAIASYLRAIELQPDYFRNYQDLGQFYFKRGKLEEAIVQYKKMVELAVDQPELHYQLATPYLSMGRYAEAERELIIATNLKELGVAVHGLGILYMLENKDHQAIPYLQRALEIGPKTSALYLNLGIAYRRVGLPRDAEQAFRNGVDVAEAKLAINPVDPYEKGYLAYLCARLGDRRRAESEAAQAMQLSRGANDDVRWVTALTYEALGMHDRTLSVIEDAPAALVIRLNQTPEMAELRRLPHFQELLKARQVE